jgi:hypothetical protein
MRPRAQFTDLVAEPADEGSGGILRLALTGYTFLGQALGGRFSEQTLASFSAGIKIKFYRIHRKSPPSGSTSSIAEPAPSVIK